MPQELQTIHYLSGRQTLSQSLEEKRQRLERGFSGELAFHRYLQAEKLSEANSLFSLSLRNDHNFFQIDHLYIAGNKIFLHEIKHYAGDYLLDKKKFYSLRSKREIANPFIQLERTESLLRRLLQNINSNYEVFAQVVFTHPECVVFTNNYQLPFSLQAQLKRYVTTNLAGGPPLTNANLSLINKLKKLHEKETIFDRQIKVDYDKLKKCINCPRCMGEMKRLSRRTVACRQCANRISNEKAIVFNLRQLQHLFPQKKLTISLSLDWLGQQFSYYIVNRVLQQYFS